MSSIIGLTNDEKEVLNHLTAAWNKFVSLNEKHPHHDEEFMHTIHAAQYIIGVRVAQRVNPEIWYIPVYD